MASLEADAAPLGSENRRYQRVKVDLLGRYMLEDRREFPCQVVDMSPGGMAVIAPQCGKLGERVVAYIDHIGRLEGMIARIYPSGFSMSISASQRKRDKLSAQLTWLANRSILDLPEDRRHQRVATRDQTTTVRMEAGAEEKCRIVDLSVSGVAVISDNRPPIGSTVRVGKAPGRVVRHLESGFAVEFTRVQNPDILKDTIAG
jgi:c-di-GMP-binding flagellar brake protein YcgR